jgi:hypothetical protein
MEFRPLIDAAMPALYRFAAFFMQTMLDDAAMLAMAFC